MSVAPFRRPGDDGVRDGVAGSLASLSLAELCQTLALSARSAYVRLDHDAASGDVWFEHGAVVHASAGDLEGETAFFEMLRWRTGRFEITDGPPAPVHSLSGDPMYLVLEGLRRIDEDGAAADDDEARDAIAPAARQRRPARAIVAAIVGVVSVGAAIAWWLAGTRVTDPSERAAATPEPGPVAMELARARVGTPSPPALDGVPAIEDEGIPEAPAPAVEPIVEDAAPSALVADAPRAPASDPAPLPAADLDPIALVAGVIPAGPLGPVVPPAAAPAGPSGTLVLDVVSRVESGRLVVQVDGRTRVDREVRWEAGSAARLFRRIAGTEGDRFVERIVLPAGAHELRAWLALAGSDEIREARLDVEVPTEGRVDLRLVASRKRGGHLDIRDPR